MSGLPGTGLDLAAVLAGFALTLGYFVAGVVTYVIGHRTARERLHRAGCTLVRLSPLPVVLGLLLAGVAVLSGSGFAFPLGAVAAALLAIGVPVLSVTSAVDRHAIE
jgi:hypothetical protein